MIRSPHEPNIRMALGRSDAPLDEYPNFPIIFYDFQANLNVQP